MLKPFFSLLVFLVSTVGSHTLAQEPELLAYRLRKGEVLVVEQEAEQQITQQIDGSEHRLTNRVSGKLQFKVVGKQDGNYLLDFEFKDLVFSIVSNIEGELLNIRAQELDPTNVQSRLFHSLLNTPVRMELSPRGKILEVKGGDSLVARMVASTGLEDGFTKTLIRKSLEQEYGSRALADSYEQLTFFYPAGQVQVGSSWKNTFGGKLEASNTWTLDSLFADRAVISGEAAISIQTEEPGTAMALEGTQHTLIKTDRRSGFMSQMNVESSAEGVSTLAQTGNLEIPTRITTRISYTLIDHKHVQ